MPVSHLTSSQNPLPSSKLAKKELSMPSDERFCFDPGTPLTMNTYLDSGVFLGQDKDGKSVIIKRGLLHSGPLSTEESLLTSANFAKTGFANRVIGCINEENHRYLVLAYVPGDSLYTIIKKKGEYDLSLSAVLKIVNSLLLSTSRLHQNKIFLQDIHPGNFIYDPQTQNTVPIDFGFARTEDLLSEEIGNGEQFYNIYTAKNLDGKTYLATKPPYLYNVNTEWFSTIKITHVLVTTYVKKYPELYTLMLVLEKELEYITNLQCQCLAVEKEKHPQFYYDPSYIRRVLAILHCMSDPSILPGLNLKIEAAKQSLSMHIDLVVAQIQAMLTNQDVSTRVELQQGLKNLAQLKHDLMLEQNPATFYRYKQSFDAICDNVKPFMSGERQGLLYRISQSLNRILGWLFPSYAARTTNEALLQSLCKTPQRPTAPSARSVCVM